jgi:hypothetical protein
MFFMALFFPFFMIQISWAKPIPAIENARKSLAEKNRKEATGLLISAIESEKNPAILSELKKELDREATLFFTNEGQRLFELAESIRYSGQAGYMPKYELSLKLEDLNWLILINQSVADIRNKDYALALKTLEQAETINPGKPEANFLKNYAKLCAGEDVPAEELERAIISSAASIKKSALSKRALAKGESEMALDRAREAISSDKNYPMGYYWAWQALKKEEDYGLDEAQRYLRLCKDLTAMQRRKYNLDPELCLDTAGPEEFIKKMENHSNE